MKLKSLISALVVFTLVMTCAMSAVSAANCSFTTTTTYSVTEDVTNVTVETTVATGLSDGSMVSYIIYDDSAAPSESTIKYIDQKTASGGMVEFGVTDTVDKLYGKKILMGSNLDTLSAAADADVNGYVTVNPTDLLVTIDAEPVVENNTLTVLVHQNIDTATVNTGINVKVKDNTGAVVNEFKNLANLSGNTYYAIELVDSTNSLFQNGYTYEIAPYVVEGDEMVKVGNYWVVAE